MATDTIVLDGTKTQKLVAEIVKAFGTPEALATWFGQEYPAENVHNVLVGNAFDTKVVNLLLWARANGTDALLQKLADRPPASSQLPFVVYFVSDGTIKPTSGGGLAAVPPIDSPFVTQRPFVNRLGLRQQLRTFETAQPGADSVLFIEGERFSGKTHGVRFARQVAPSTRFSTVDVAQFYAGQLNAAELAGALAQDTALTGFGTFDLTKEFEAVPRLIVWLTSKLQNTGRWLIVDHCERPALTDAGRELLIQLAATIAEGSLPGVRLILADVQSSRLPPTVQRHGRSDTAVLPNVRDVEEWRRSLGQHLGKTLTAPDPAGYAATVFNDIGAIPPDDMPGELETRLFETYRKILALP